MKWVIKGYEQKECISLLLPSLSHRQHISLWHIKGRGVAIRIGSVLKQHRVLTSYLEETTQTCVHIHLVTHCGGYWGGGEGGGKCSAMGQKG